MKTSGHGKNIFLAIWPSDRGRPIFMIDDSHKRGKAFFYHETRFVIERLGALFRKRDSGKDEFLRKRLTGVCDC